MPADRKIEWKVRALAVLAVALATGCSATTQFQAQIKSASPLVRQATVAELGEKGGMSCYDELVVALRNDSSRLVRSEAAFSLGKLGQRYYSVGFIPLLDSLENDPSVFVRAASALSLSYTRDSRAVEPLVIALRDVGRGRMAVLRGERVIVYRACVADAARTSLERVMEMSFVSTAETAEAKRGDIATKWENWFGPRRPLFPGGTALASK